MRIRPATLVLCLAASLVACGGSGGDAAPAGPGVLLVTRPDGILRHELASHHESILIADASGAQLLDPAISPDGERIAYILYPTPSGTAQTFDTGSDIWLAARDGTAPRVVFAHDVPTMFIRYATWLNDDTLLAVVIETEKRAGQTQFLFALESFDVETGERQRLIDNAITFGLSPDRSHIVFSRYGPGGESLLVAAADGSGERVILPATAGFLGIGAPRYTPDAARIAFGAADAASISRGQRYVSASSSVAPPPAPAGHGPPQDLWIMDAAGGDPRLLTELKEDEPALAWNRDATRLYALGGSGLYDLNIESGLSRRIGEGFYRGGLEWAPE